MDETETWRGSAHTAATAMFGRGTDRASAFKNYTERVAGSTYLTTPDGRTRTLASDWYTPGGRAVRKLVRFYWQHPECRDELTDGRAAQRLAEPW